MIEDSAIILIFLTVGLRISGTKSEAGPYSQRAKRPLQFGKQQI